MLLFSARRSSQGFTLIEMLVIVTMVGILSAIAAPSFLASLNRAKVRDAQTKVSGALKEAQREALRKSKNCTVVVPSGNNVTLTSPTEDLDNDGVLDAGEDLNSNGVLDKNGCLITGDRHLKDIALRRSNSSITFNFRGGTPSGSGSTIVLTLPDDTATQQKCLVIAAPGIGIMRTGNYDDPDATGTDSNKCTTTQ